MFSIAELNEAEIILGICPTLFFIFIIFLFAIVFILYTKRYQFESFEIAFLFQTQTILKSFYRSLIIVGILTIPIAIYLMVIAVISPVPLIILIGIALSIPLLGSLIFYGYFIKTKVMVNLLKSSPLISVMTKIKTKKKMKKLVNLFSHLENLKLLVRWVNLVGSLLIVWGLYEIPYSIIFYEEINSFELAQFYFLVPAVKITIGVLLLIASNQLMIKPLLKPGFWKSSLS